MPLSRAELIDLADSFGGRRPTRLVDPLVPWMPRASGRGASSLCPSVSLRLNETADPAQSSRPAQVQWDRRHGPEGQIIASTDAGIPNILRNVRLKCAESAKPASCAALVRLAPAAILSTAVDSRRHST